MTDANGGYPRRGDGDRDDNRDAGTDDADADLSELSDDAAYQRLLLYDDLAESAGGPSGSHHDYARLITRLFYRFTTNEWQVFPSVKPLS